VLTLQAINGILSAITHTILDLRAFNDTVGIVESGLTPGYWNPKGLFKSERVIFLPSANLAGKGNNPLLKDSKLCGHDAAQVGCPEALIEAGTIYIGVRLIPHLRLHNKSINDGYMLHPALQSRCIISSNAYSVHRDQYSTQRNTQN